MIQKLIVALCVVTFGALMALMLVEWAAGCGETYIDANGVRHSYECLFIK